MGENQRRFRPLAGIMVLIALHDYAQAYQDVDKFPSPCGDYGSYHVEDLGDGIRGIAGFRPLAGIMVLIMICKPSFPFTVAPVSVPLRGLWFLSCSCQGTDKDAADCVSVPLRGLWFLSFMVLVGLDTISHLVSVPLRGLWFLSCRKRANKKWIRESFRPLAGIMVLINEMLEGKTFPCPVSVPLGGLWFLSVIFLKIRRDLYEIRFRPLAGIMVLIVLFA